MVLEQQEASQRHLVEVMEQQLQTFQRALQARVRNMDEQNYIIMLSFVSFKPVLHWLNCYCVSSLNMVPTVQPSILRFWIECQTNFKIAKHGLDSSLSYTSFLN